jgi:hypothetical protein
VGAASRAGRSPTADRWPHILAWERIISDDVWLVREDSLGADGRIVAAMALVAAPS